MPDRMTVAGAGERGVGDVLDRAADRVGEVAGDLLDQHGQHDADEHGDERDDGRVAGRRRDDVVVAAC